MVTHAATEIPSRRVEGWGGTLGSRKLVVDFDTYDTITLRPSGVQGERGHVSRMVKTPICVSKNVLRGGFEAPIATFKV